ncbi:MAG: MerR family transcriptional regulator [Brachybacterium sp.]|uniref:MerR family transcriptional regulator n=1 Tax=unclassified Brachybacterium TaxID=2623841 RepID=UPI003FE256FA
MSLLIGEVSARSGLSHDTLRYYERVGMIPAPERDATGRRRYDAAVLDLLRIVDALRRAGFSLAQVSSVLEVKARTRTVRGRTVAMRQAIALLEQDLDSRTAAIADARSLLSSWQEELDAGEPWPDTPLDC